MKGTTIELAATAAFRLNVLTPPWFHPILFANKHVKENPKDFLEFFGTKGKLLYYPVALILVKGFSATFISAQKWTYDYVRDFSAGSGGGFSLFGVNFGSSSSYKEHTEEHKVDQSDTKLTFSDDKETLRFVGFAVAKNSVFEAFYDGALRDASVIPRA